MAETIKRTKDGPAAGPARTPTNPYRPQRLAAATTDGELIDACFGKTEKFLIFELSDRPGATAGYEQTETRPGPGPCGDGEHDQALLERTADLLSDCGLVLAGKIGPGALKVLENREVIGLPVRLGLAEALKRLAAKK